MSPFSFAKSAAVATSLAAVATGISITGVHAAPPATAGAARQAGLPVKAIEKALQADGEVSHGVLQVDLDRSDVSAVGGQSQVPFVTGFQLQHELDFQSLGRHRAIINGDLALKPQEIQPVIDTLVAKGLKVQAEHQHLYDISPMMWFVHFRGVGKPKALARKAEAAIAKTSTPQPQSQPTDPTTPLPTKRLAHVLGGDASVGENGVVTVDVDRSNQMRLGGVRIKPGLNVATNVQFEPTADGGAVAVADVAMTSGEINPVLRVMRHRGWESGCLYNQETAEHPQLYFDHFFKTGDPVTLARQVRKALNHTDSES